MFPPFWASVSWSVPKKKGFNYIICEDFSALKFLV